ncbi:MAG TPA: nucleoside-diphosphate sugar epimerase/dehydratase [Paludibacteraceae bacterium]|nr:nucleoside-diphosphate sugar epimerase/dehydratase [Paludibacteraceae bacterium]
MKEKFRFLNNTDTFSHLASLKYLPRWAVLFIDIAISAISFLTAYLIASAFIKHLPDRLLLSLFQRLILLLITQTGFFWLFHTYSGILRYSTMTDATKLFLAIFSNCFFLSALNFVCSLYISMPLFYYSSILIYGFIAFILLFGIRLTVRNIFNYFVETSAQIIPVMIYGIDEAGLGIARMILSSVNSKKQYKLVGFIDGDGNAVNKMVMGIRVYNHDDQTIKTKVANKVNTVIVSPIKMKEINPDEDLDVFIQNHISLLTSQPMDIWNGEMPSVRQIKPLKIEDLLEREPIQISFDDIALELKSKTVMVTGAAGSIGSEIVRQLCNFSPKLIVLVDNGETAIHNLRIELQNFSSTQNFSFLLGDVRNKERMEYIMDLYRPDFVFHAAAYKHVPLMEDFPCESVQVNVLGTKIMADLALKYKVSRFVMVSTDKAVNPTNVMGATKRIAEIYVQSLARKMQKTGNETTKFITTRFGNVLGSNGSVVPFFQEQIEKGGPVTVTHPDIIRYFMTVPEASSLVLEAGVMGEGGEIYVFDMGNPVKISHLAKKMIQMAGLIPGVDIQIVYTGLRPGEKLYEELLNHTEQVRPTNHPKIMVASVAEYDFDKISVDIDNLIKYSYLCKDFLVVSMMKQIVPEFKSNNSQYELLDINN